MIYTSVNNPKIKAIASLKDKKGRKEQSAYLVEGIKMVKEAIACGADIKQIIGTCKVLEENGIPEGGKVICADEKVMKYVCDSVTPQGIAAVIGISEGKLMPPSDDCIILDGIQDPGNMGTIVRTAAAVGIKDIYTITSADAFSPKAVRSSMSGIYFVNIHSIKYEDLHALFKDKRIIVADMGGENIFSFKNSENFALVIGNEANGVSDYIKGIASCSVSIPMSKNVESLNAGVSCAIALYQLKYTK